MSDTSQYTSTELQSAPQHTPSVRGVNFRARARRERIRECKEISGAVHAEPGNPWTRPGHGEFHGRVRDWKLLETRRAGPVLVSFVAGMVAQMFLNSYEVSMFEGWPAITPYTCPVRFRVMGNCSCVDLQSQLSKCHQTKFVTQ
ncbi:hypothetical protein Bbelb_132120 [Branchiostoma belcheri]|nr:hypothetical protein Bbelb_132120 [Branchiostoma belcheri]